MRVLVTGAPGFIGSHVCRNLVARSHDVVGLALPGEGLARLSDVADRMTVEMGDLADPTRIRELIARWRPEAAIHLAWYAAPGAYWTADENLDCVAQGFALVRTLAHIGCSRFVGIGTCAEYDWAFEMLDEERTPCRPRTLYGAAKHALFLVAERYCALNSLSFAWARYGFTFGPGESAGRLVPQVASALLRGEDVPCTNGQQRRDFLCVEELADATVALMESRVQGPVNVGSGEARPVADLVSRLSTIIGGTAKPLLGAKPSDPAEPPVLELNVARLRDMVRWRPRTSFDDALRRSVDDMRRRLAIE
jgi:nucleoside-diphosphate-sugar epimerase